MNLVDLEDFLDLLASQPRLKIIGYLQECPLQTVGDIAMSTRLPHNTVSRHLQLLASRRLVQSQQEGQYVRYCLNQLKFREGFANLEQIVRLGA